MRKMLSTVALVLCAVLVLGVIATAQPGGGRGQGGPGGRGPGGPGGFGGGGMLMLVNNADFKAQLGITDEQAQQITKIAEDARAATPQRPRGEGGGPPAPPSAEERAAMQQRFQETQNKIKAVLSPEQQEKAKVLVFQVAGGIASANANVLEVLNLTDDQKAKLVAINEELGPQRREIFANMPGRDASQEERQKFFTEAQAKNEALTKPKVESILTDEQKAKAVKLTEEGKDIREKFQQQMRQRGPGGPGGGGNAGGEGGAYQPGANSWQPGQGGGNNPNRQQRRNFPQRDNAQ